MKPIKLVQYGSTIAILTFLAYLLVMGALIMFGAECVAGDMGDLMQQCVMFAMFVGPEKLVAFFGPALKRMQENGNGGKENGK